MKRVSARPSNDANCSAPGCDCGGVPCGRYLYDHRNASMRAWLINEHILGATGIGNAKQRPLLRRFVCKTVACQDRLWTHATQMKLVLKRGVPAGNENISAIYLDDNWQTFAGGESPSPLGGPTEVGA